MPPRILIVGNSHTQALLKAGNPHDFVEIQWLKTKDDARHGTLDLHEATRKVGKLRPQDALVLSSLGSLHNILGLVNHEHPYTCADALVGEGIGDKNLIPMNSLHAAFRDHIARDRIVSAFAGIAACPVYHLMTPPPKETLKPPNDSGKQYHGRSISQMGFSPASLRIALWRIEELEIISYLSRLNVTHLPPPMGTRTESGFLKNIYYANDITHANSDYGKLVLDQVVATVKSRITGSELYRA